MTDLTERLAAKLYEVPYFNTPQSERIARYAGVVLPLLLSEPELVAGLAPEVKREVLDALLRERLDESGVMDALSDAHENGFPSKHWVRNILAPSPAPMEGRSHE